MTCQVLTATVATNVVVRFADAFVQLITLFRQARHVGMTRIYVGEIDNCSYLKRLAKEKKNQNKCICNHKIVWRGLLGLSLTGRTGHGK